MTWKLMWPVLALAAALGMAHAIATPAFWPVDETSHVAYATQLVDTGTLPTIDTPIPRDLAYPGFAQRLAWERDQGRVGRQDIWTSNHPPLPYVVQGVALRLGRLAAGGEGALLLARLTSTAWLVAATYLAMQLAWLLTPRRDGDGARRGGVRAPHPATTAVLAGAVVATTPTLTHLGGLVFNDVPAVAMSTGALLAGATLALRGVTARRVLVLGAVCGAAALTRVSCLPAVGVAGLMGLYALWHHGLGDLSRRRLAGLVGLAALPAVPAALFWLRNIRLYGDVTAEQALFEKFRRDLNDPIGELVPDHTFWLKMWNRGWSDLTTGHWAVGMRADLTELLLLAALLGLACTAWRARPRRSADGPGSAGAGAGRARAALAWPLDAVRRAARRPRTVVWLLAALLPLSLVVTTVQFHSAGGSLHGRYLLGGHAVTATALVLVLAQVPRIGTALAVAAPAVLLVVDSLLLQALLLHHPIGWTRPDILMVLPQLAGTATDDAVLWLTMAAAALLAVAVLAVVPRPAGRPGPYDAPSPSKRPIRESAAA